MCLRDISRKIEAHARNERNEWERARLISYMAVSPYLEKGAGSMEDVIPFEWDKERKIERNRKKVREYQEKMQDPKRRKFLDFVEKKLNKDG